MVVQLLMFDVPIIIYYNPSYSRDLQRPNGRGDHAGSQVKSNNNYSSDGFHPMFIIGSIIISDDLRAKIFRLDYYEKINYFSTEIITPSSL